MFIGTATQMPLSRRSITSADIVEKTEPLTMFYESAIFIFVVFYGTTTNCLKVRSEPECSRFHYEEQLLEKMIRLEIKFESLLEHVSKVEASVNEQRRALSEERAVQKLDLENWMESSRGSIDSHVDEMKTVFEDQQMKISMLSGDLVRLLNETVTDRKDLLTPKPVAFEAHKVTTAGPAAGETIVFYEAQLNDGGGYDEKTGVFTAPVGGVYLFMVQLCIKNDKYIRFDIIADGVIQTASKFFRQTSHYACFSTQGVAKIKPEARVHVQSNHDHSSVFFDSRYYVNSFTGILITKI